MWKSLRTTNALENLNREFRRRTKTLASFTTEAAAVTVLSGPVALGHVVLQDRWPHGARGVLGQEVGGGRVMR